MLLYRRGGVVSDILFFREDKRPAWSTVSLGVRERRTFIILFTEVDRPVRIVFGHKLCVTTHCSCVCVCVCVWLLYICCVDGTTDNNPLLCSSCICLCCENRIVIDDRTSDREPSEIDNNGK